MLMVKLVTEIQKHFPSFRRIRNATCRLLQIHPVPTMEIRLLYDDYVPWLNLVPTNGLEICRNAIFSDFFQDRYLVCHRYVIASDGPISDFTQYFIGSITNHSCDVDMLYFSMASYSGWWFGTCFIFP